MAEIRGLRVNGPELARALRDHRPPLSQIGWLLGISSRWAGELTRSGDLPAGGTFPEIVKAWGRYQAKRPRPGAAREAPDA